MQTGSILDLPTSIFLYIRDFLYIYEPSTFLADRFRKDETDFLNYNQGKRSWRDFLIISNQTYWREHVRKHLLFLSLSRFSSNRYLYDESFRNRCRSLIHDPSKQLGLDFTLMRIQRFTKAEAALLSNVFQLDLSYNPLVTLPEIHHVFDVDLNCCFDLVDISGLHDIKHLNLHSCKLLIQIPERLLQECDFIDAEYCLSLRGINLAPWKNVKSNGLTGFRVSITSLQAYAADVYNYLTEFRVSSPRDVLRQEQYKFLCPIPRLEKLDVRRVTIPDVSIYPKLKYLGVVESEIQSGMEALTDLESLRCTRSRLPKAFELSSLPKLKKLLLSEDSPRSYLISSIPYHQLSSLILHGRDSQFSAVAIVPEMQYLQYVKLFYCGFLQNVSVLKNVRHIIFEYCQSIDSLVGLGENQIQVEVVECGGINNANNLIDDVSMLKNVRQVTLDTFPALTKVRELTNVEFLSLRGCENIADFREFGRSLTNRLRMLNLTACLRLQDSDLPYLATIPNLIISYCPLITDLAPLRNEKLSAIFCLSLKATSIYGDQWKKLDFKDCDNLKVLRIFGKVESIRVPKVTWVTVMNEGRIDNVVNFFYGTIDASPLEIEHNDRDQFSDVCLNMVPEDEDQIQLLEDQVGVPESEAGSNDEDDDEEMELEDEDEDEDEDEVDEFGEIFGIEDGGDEEEEENNEDGSDSSGDG